MKREPKQKNLTLKKRSHLAIPSSPKIHRGEGGRNGSTALGIRKEKVKK